MSATAGAASVWWAPRRLTWWIGVLFAVGSTCFFVGPFPGFVELVGAVVDGLVFFVGSIFFTTAAGLQWIQTVNGRGSGFRIASFEPLSLDWWSSGVQFIGTLFFNVDTFRALQQGLDAQAYDRLVWTPDAVGSACFLVSGYLAYVEVSGHLLRPPRVRTRDWNIAAVNLVGCVAFGISAIAAFWVPSEGSVVDLAAANAFTAFGGLCFLVGAILLVRGSRDEHSLEPSPRFEACA